MPQIRAALVRLGFAIGRRFPIVDEVVLATAHADRISGNLAFIRDGLTTARPDLPVVVLSRRARRGRRAQAVAAIDSIVAGWHLARARVFVVDDYYFPMYVIQPRPGTKRFQVWHACGAFKRFGYSLLGRSFGVDEQFVAEFAIHTNYDLCLVSAARFAPFYAEAFRQPIERFTASFGVPRTDLFFQPDRIAAVRAELRARYRIPEGRRIILYAPTFRGDRITLARSPEELDLRALASALAADHVLLLRAHPFVSKRARMAPELAEFVIDVSDEPEIDELMLVSDVLVTDYSSAIYEFALLERPMAFFAPDHAAYEAERGFYLEIPDDLPGPVFESTDALTEWLRAGTPDLERVRRFRAASFDVADGHSTERFIRGAIGALIPGRPPLS